MFTGRVAGVPVRVQAGRPGRLRDKADVLWAQVVCRPQVEAREDVEGLEDLDRAGRGRRGVHGDPPVRGPERLHPPEGAWVRPQVGQGEEAPALRHEAVDGMPEAVVDVLDALHCDFRRVTTRLSYICRRGRREWFRGDYDADI